MRGVWIALALCLCASGAQAQVEQGSFKLSIDTDAFSISSVRVSGRFSDPEESGDYESTTTEYAFGPGSSALAIGMPGYVALAFGYAAHAHLIPQLRVSFWRVSGNDESTYDGDTDDSELPLQTSIMLRPELEIPFNPHRRVVGYGLIGFDYRHMSESEDDGNVGEIEYRLNAFGPVVGVGVHIFVGSVASFDLGAEVNYLVIDSEVETDGEPDEYDTDSSAIAFALKAGISLWL